MLFGAEMGVATLIPDSDSIFFPGKKCIINRVDHNNGGIRKKLRLNIPTAALISSNPARNNCLSLPNPVKNIKGLCDLEVKGSLGKGSEGSVYKVLSPKSSSYYALKVVRLHFNSNEDEKIMREVEIMKKLNSPRIVEFHGAFEEGGNVNFVLEYMDGGSLQSFLKLNLNKRMKEDLLAKVGKDVLEGLKYLQSEKIVHRDIKPANLLVKLNPFHVKIADFGMSAIASEIACNSYSTAGTYAYMSPERFDPQTYGKESVLGCDDYCYKGDVWSLGVTLMECYVGHFPFVQPEQEKSVDWATLLCAICLEDVPTLPPTASSEFQSFIGCCLQKDVGKRWTASQLLTHPFITDQD